MQSFEGSQREQWRPLRIFGISWHVPHSYSLITSLPHTQFDYYLPPYRAWAHEARPQPSNLNFTPWYQAGKYDLAILHVDGECAMLEARGGNTKPKGHLYRKLNELIQDVPKIVINHGTPYVPEVFEKYFKHITDEERKTQLAKDMCIRNMKELIGENTMVVNSKQAAKDWGWGTPIVHGMAGNPQEEYFDLDKEPVVMFMVSPAGWGTYYNRRVMNDTQSILEDYGIKTSHLRVNVKFRSFDEYREYIGKALISVHVARHSPMPRSRTEHLLSGGCVVTGKNHDIGELFTGLEFRQTQDGELIKDEAGNLMPLNVDEAELVWCDIDKAKDVAHKVIWLYENPDIAKAIGQRGKQKAQQVFGVDRYRNDWYRLLKENNIL